MGRKRDEIKLIHEIVYVKNCLELFGSHKSEAISSKKTLRDRNLGAPTEETI